MAKPNNAITELTWTTNGDEYELVRFVDLPTTPEGWVALLEGLMKCDTARAEEAYRILFEVSDSFTESVRRDIALLPTKEVTE